MAYIIKKEQNKCKKGKARKVEVLNENGDTIAKSSDILEIGKLKYLNNTKENEK